MTSKMAGTSPDLAITDYSHHIVSHFILHISGFIFHIPHVSPQKQWNVIYRYAALAAVLLALIGIGFAFLPKVNQFRNYQETKYQLEEDIRIEEERIKELRLKQEKFSTDKHFVQKIAHEIGFAHEGEVIFQFNDQPATNDEARRTQFPKE
jgi:hypothetical protein